MLKNHNALRVIIATAITAAILAMLFFAPGLVLRANAATPNPSVTASQTSSRTPTATRTPTPRVSVTATRTPAATTTRRATVTRTATPSPTIKASPTRNATTTRTPATSTPATTPIATGNPAPLNGLETYTKLGCGGCHRLAAANSVGGLGPTHEHIATTAAQRILAADYQGSATTPAEYIAESILDIDAYIVPEFRTTRYGMPDYSFATDEQVLAIVAFLMEQK